MKLLFSLLVVFIFMLPLSACKAEEAVSPSPTNNQLSIIEKLSLIEQNSLEYCAQNVTFQINGVSFKLDPKYHTFFVWHDLKGNKRSNIDARHVQVGCPNVELGKIRFFGSPGKASISMFSDIKKHPQNLFNFEKYRKDIEQAYEAGRAVKIQDGIDKFSFATDKIRYEFYLFSNTLASTANDEPAILECSRYIKNSSNKFPFCSVHFLHSDGVYVRRNFRNVSLAETDLTNFYTQAVEDYASYKTIGRPKHTNEKHNIPPPTEEQKLNMARSLEWEKYRNLPECEAGHIHVQLGPHVLTIPREDGIFLNRPSNDNYLGHYNDLHRPSPIASCKKTYFNDVTGISMRGMHVPFPVHTFHIGYAPDDKSTTYRGANRSIKKSAPDTRFKEKIFDDGTKYYQSNGALTYVMLPVERHSTIDNTPVTFACTTGGVAFNCRTSYVLPNGLSISYEVMNERGELFASERMARDFVNGLISKELHEKRR